MSIPTSFYTQSPTTAAQQILGGTLTHAQTSGIIVETEAYSSIKDQACHAFLRPKIREFVETHPPGTAYIYLNYGIHWLFNLTIKYPSNDEVGFILIRALEPTHGIAKMQQRRNQTNFKNLTSGPAKLTQALQITNQQHATNTNEKSSPIQLTLPKKPLENILTGTRIGITKSPHLPWRYAIQSPHISKPF